MPFFRIGEHHELQRISGRPPTYPSGFRCLRSDHAVGNLETFNGPHDFDGHVISFLWCEVPGDMVRDTIITGKTHVMTESLLDMGTFLLHVFNKFSVAQVPTCMPTTRLSTSLSSAVPAAILAQAIA